MLILITVTTLLLTAIVLLVLQFTARNFRYNWLIATGGALLGWVSVFVWQGANAACSSIPCLAA